MEQDASKDALDPPSANLKIEVTLVAKLNLADFQNSVPLLRELVIANESASVFADIEIRISATPAFLKPKTWRLDEIAAGVRCRISDLDVQLDGSVLARLTEAEQATVCLTLHHRGKGATELARRECVVELLPRNQWGGIGHMPDLVAAFVQPNDPAVDRVLKRAAEILRQNGKMPALDGYSGGSKRAWELMSGIWSAVAAMRLDYALPPASFEHAGQKVRGPGQIEESGLATCLDLALLFSAAIEQAGLNPVVVFTKGHAFAGVWLRAEEFSNTVVDDVTALRKRIKLQELVLFETTLVTQQPAPGFSYASQLGAQQVADEKDEAFELAVDIRRARLQRIKPLAAAEAPATTTAPQATDPPVVPFDEAPDLTETEVRADPATLNPKDRLARWQRKLLDLSLRNNLLNFKSSKQNLKIEAPDAGLLEDTLSEGQALKILARPDLMDGADPRNRALYESREREDVRRNHALDALKRREIYVGLQPAELESRLVQLFRSARMTLQEGGANTLYLALGFLSWTRDGKAEQKYRAPLVLIPVTLSRRSVRSGFTLTLHDDEPRFNPTLVEMLRQDFKLNLGVAEGELPRDDSGLDLRTIWDTVSRAIKDIKGWEISEEVTLAMFSFAKYLMWKDLTERTDQLRENPVVRHLIDTPREPYPHGVAFPNPRRLDQDFTPEQTFCPLPADSSQLSAVMAAARGKDFVLIGPPGTGKSQTISNVIAQCLAEGKRVLFVSEKIAALDVVYRRLREVGLGDFCLELHSNKARKLDVLAQLQKSWESKGEVDASAWRAEAQRLKRMRDDLNVYVERLHLRHANGISIFDAIGRVVAADSSFAPTLSWSSPSDHDSSLMEAMRDVVDRLGVNALAVGHQSLLAHPLAAVGSCEWSPTWQQTVVQCARDLISAARQVDSTYRGFLNASGLPQIPATRRARGAISVLARTLPHAAGRDWRFVVRDDAQAIVDRLKAGAELLRQHAALCGQLSPAWTESIAGACRRGLALLEKRRSVHAELAPSWPPGVIADLRKGLGLLDSLAQTAGRMSAKYSDVVEQINVHQLQREWTKAEKAMWPISWLGKRKVRSTLEAAVVGSGEPDVASDLQALVDIRQLRAEISKFDPGVQTAGMWDGLKTRKELANACLKFQFALDAARHERPWQDHGLEAIADGHCGERLAADLARMRAIRALDAEIEKLGPLAQATGGLWAGLATDSARLAAALSFHSALQGIREQGPLVGDHQSVADGDCGTSLQADLRTIRQRESVERSIAALEDLSALTGGLWRGVGTNPGAIDTALKFHAYISAAVAGLTSEPPLLSDIKAALDHLLEPNDTRLGPAGSVRSTGQAYVDALNVFQPKVDLLAAAGEFTEASKLRFNEIAISELTDSCKGIEASEPRMNAWCAWRKVRQQAVALGLSPLVLGLENGAIAPDHVRPAFEVAYCRWWLNAVVDREPIIRSFVSAEHEKRIHDLRALEGRYTRLTQAWVRASLCGNLPDQDSVARSSEWGILRHEMSKKKRHMPLRELMKSIPSALTKLTPCLLMSPLSIAQYLSADASAFDVVVFDEASQIPVWDAIGAIARGKQVVMVGDPKQLPPTNFFDRAESAADEEDVEGDLESILDECLGANLPTMNLAWHYRSRNESLIAFSNHRYYGGSLVTFPSPMTEDRAVSFHYVPGTYEKGGARINKAEAKAVVADIIERLRMPGFRESKLTIGVVTFNAEQQGLIEDLLDEERRRDPSIEPLFAEVELEPLFVKNLESVQGDERDIMYFSITYGPDLHGAVSMNFGPLNRDGGERRLNVAITRARHELRVFSSLKPEQMDLARTQALGVRDLKHFLDFADRGPRALAEATRASQGDFESPFEEAVAAALTAKGWALQTQIGASKFRVDLAVVHPDAQGIYLAGVECDGATYHRSATARDRDMLREQVLRGLGWEILRVWSTDWWVDRDSTLRRLDEKLHGLLTDSRARRAAAAEQEAARLAVAAALTKASAEATVEPPLPLAEGEIGDGINQSDAVPGKPEQQRVAIVSGVELESYARNTSSEKLESSATYLEVDPATAVAAVAPGQFFERSYDTVLLEMIRHVVENEGPVLDDVLARRIARAHGWQKTGSRIQERVEGLAATAFQTTTEDVGKFYWPTSKVPGIPFAFRRPADDAGRALNEICIPELVALAREVLARDLGADAAIVAMARDIGLQRLRAASRGRLEQAIELARST
jgi:very-short-patch-repair endonuclease